MGNRVIADNWSLQTIAELVHNGLDPDDSPGITPLTDPDAAPTADIPQAAIDLETLFDFLADITLRDQILVDQAYGYTWTGGDGPLSAIAGHSIIKLHPFTEDEPKLAGPRQDFVRKMVLNERMGELQRENEAAWAETGASRNAFAAQLIWGGAGMLARAWVNEAPYTPHPLRRRLFERTRVCIPGPASAMQTYKQAISQHRTTLYRSPASSEALYGAQVLLPAIPAIVLREATSLTDVFTVALQVRERLLDLRGWLSQYQDVLTAGDFKALSPHSKRLDSIAKDVERALGIKGKEGATLSVGLSFLKVSYKLDPAQWLSRLDRVQVQASSLAFAPSGGEELRKLLGFFGHRHSALGARVSEHFSAPRS